MTTKVNTSVLANTSVAGSAGNYGGSTKIPFFKVDDQGRLQTVGNTDPSIATSQLTGSIQANQLANNATFGINITGSAGTANSAGSVPASGLTGTQYSYVSTSRPGPTRLYRDDNDSGFNIRTFYNGSTNRWVLHGYNNDALHNGVEVAYANTVKDGVVTSSTYSDPSWLTLTKSKVGLGNVDNTADADKSVNYANTAGNGGVTSVNGNTGAVIVSTLGINQTLQDLTSTRQLNTTYTNNTGRPIQVYVSMGYGDCDIRINGIVFAHSKETGAANILVPPGAQYSATAATGRYFNTWYEYR